MCDTPTGNARSPAAQLLPVLEAGLWAQVGLLPVTVLVRECQSRHGDSSAVWLKEDGSSLMSELARRPVVSQLPSSSRAESSRMASTAVELERS